MHYDFIEIGTSDFHTLCQTCADNEIGISVEPVTECINNLPNRSNVAKVNAALVTEEYFATNKHISIFYIDKQTIVKENLGGWIRGCNKVNEPHEKHLDYIYDIYSYNWEKTPQQGSRNLVEEGLVTEDIVPCITWKRLFDEFNVTSIGYVKIDAEGADADIVLSLMEECFRRENIELFPKSLRFEIRHAPKLYLAIEILRHSYYDVKVDPECQHDMIAERLVLDNDKLDMYRNAVLDEWLASI